MASFLYNAALLHTICPDDLTALIVYADWCEEQGEDAQAQAARFVYRCGWHPDYNLSEWVWWDNKYVPWMDHKDSDLPHHLFNCLGPGRYRVRGTRADKVITCRCYKSLYEAYIDLIQALCSPLI